MEVDEDMYEEEIRNYMYDLDCLLLSLGILDWNDDVDMYIDLTNYWIKIRKNNE